MSHTIFLCETKIVRKKWEYVTQGRISQVETSILMQLGIERLLQVKLNRSTTKHFK